MPTAAIYVRHESGQTELQAIILQHYAARQDYTITATYIDRPTEVTELDKLVADVKTHKDEITFQTLIITSTTRLCNPKWTADRNVRRVKALRSIFNAAGIRIVTYYNEVDPDEERRKEQRRQEEKKHELEDMAWLMGKRY